jgi:hypothetical protein
LISCAFADLRRAESMANPWLKKNPFMSMWLSGANAVAGSLRGHAAGQIKREAGTAMTKATNDVFDFWTAGLMAPPTKKRRRTRRR